jgi:hypothetical protein
VPRGRLYSGSGSPPGGTTGDGLRVEYYDNIDFTGLAGTRVDSSVDFNWGGSAPLAGMGVDTFSVRWTGRIEAPATGVYTFYTVSDDGVRLWVNGAAIINNWSDHSPSENSGTVVLVAGQQYDIRLEYYERGGGAVMRLLWSGPSIAKSIVPTARLYSNR